MKPAEWFYRPRVLHRRCPKAWGVRRLVGNAARLGLHQIDSVNVLARAHYLPAFSRLGNYDVGVFNRMAWGGKRRQRYFFEYWGHEASLIPLEDYPLFHWRMRRADRGETGYPLLRRIAVKRRNEAWQLLGRIREEGPLAASDFEKGKTGWWAWSDAKHLLEWLFYAEYVTTSTRRPNFERMYDVSDRVIPSRILNQNMPGEEEAHRALAEKAALSLGAATVKEIGDYYRTGRKETAAAVAQLAEEGILLPVGIEGWPAAYRHKDATCPPTTERCALLAPFDPLIWERARTERLFEFRYRIEIYTPKEKRRYGYYVLPFLYHGRLVARVDLKADRKKSVLAAYAVHYESGRDSPDVREALNFQLHRMAMWL